MAEVSEPDDRDRRDADGPANAEAEELLARIREGGPVPVHIAVIMDGNGRWARGRGLPRWAGHRRGMDAVRETVEGCLEAGVRHVTLYAFSAENWRRPPEEVSALMELLKEFVEREKEDLREHGVRVRVFGELDRLPDGARKAVEEIQHHTREGDDLDLNLAISYSSRAEIVGAARTLASMAALGALAPEEITEDRFEEELYTAGFPDPDLLIRTSGELRLSNFLLWQAAYSEIHVTPTLWPDFGREDLYRAIVDFQGRERRFGRVEA